MNYFITSYTLLILLTAIMSFLIGRWWVRRSYSNPAKHEPLTNLNDIIASKPWEDVIQRLDENQKITDEKIHKELGRLHVQDFPSLEFSTMKYQLTTLINDQKKLESSFQALHKRIDILATSNSDDLNEFYDRIDLIENLIKRFENLNQKQTEVERQEDSSEPSCQAEQHVPLNYNNILGENNSPASFGPTKYGQKDDLKRIQGIGPKLEQRLNQCGVNYFWQIAEWNNEDIESINDKLNTIKGRISRDQWVKQAKALKNGITSCGAK